MKNELTLSNNVSFLLGGGEMGALMRSHDWSQTPLGEVETWPQSLKTAVQMILGSRYPMFVWWGESLTNFYNDAYIPVLGKRHPHALGQPASQIWAEIWDTLGPQTDAVLHQGQATWNQELLLIMERNDYPEETYFTFSYSPIANDRGGIGGVFCACTEETQRVLSDRRLGTLRELAAEATTVRTTETACELSATVLTHNAHDIPFALLYLLDGDRAQARLISTVRLPRGTIASPEIIELTSPESSNGWQLTPVMETGKCSITHDLTVPFGLLPGGTWSQAPNQAVILPLTQLGEAFGFLIVGVSPLRPLDDDYQGFFDLVAGQVATTVTNAQAYEKEHKRAEALAELDRAKTAFFSNVSHEFRTPLTLMLSPLEELSNSWAQRLQPDEREQLQLIQRNGLRLQKLVNTLLEFSRIEARRVQAFYEPIELATYTAELASTFRSLIEQAGMNLEIDCSPIAEPVYVDREMWEKIVLNLLSNAFKFTFAGSIAVRLRSVGNAVELSVRDTGVGIPAAELPRLFERFHRVSGMRSRTYEGSGIGLALVQELVKLHQGAIDVTSVEGEGTCFTVSIPTGTAHLPPDRIGTTCALASTALGANPYLAEAARWLPQERSEFSVLNSELTSESSIQTSTFKPQTARILLADDNADMRDYVRRLLSQQYEVKAEPDGVTALSAIRQQMPDLVLTDVMMPNLDGLGLLQALRSDPQTQEIPIILLSARAGEEARIEGLEAGANDYLTKPFSARELLVRVEANLKLAQLRREAMQKEQALRQEAETAQQQVETTLSSIRDGFYTLDRDWRFTYVNDRFCRIARMQREELLGQGIWDLFADTVDTDFYIQFQQSLTEQLPLQFEYFYESWNLWYENRIYPSPTGLTVFVADITDRKQTELQIQQLNRDLARQADELQTILNATPVGIAIANDPQCSFIRSNRFAQTMLGISPDTNVSATGEQAESLPFRQFRDGQEIPGDQLPMQLATARKQEVRDAEIHVVRSDGATFDWWVNAVPLFDEQEAVRGCVAAFMDVTELKQAEAKLHETLTLLNAISDYSLDIIFAKDREGRLLFVNPAISQYFGKSVAELIGKDEFFFMEDRAAAAAIRANDLRIMQSGVAEVLEEPIVINGNVRTFISTKAPLRDAHGNIMGIIGIGHDMTDRKQAEVALAERNQELDSFVHIVSHDLKAPLRAISNLSEWIEDDLEGQLPPENQQQFQLLRARTKRMESMINSLLVYARAGRQEAPLETFNVAELLDEIIDSLAPPQSFSIEIAPPMPTLNTKRLFLSQVFANLVSNAIKHHTSVEGHLNLSAIEQQEFYEFSVRDDGPGIAPEDRAKVFEIFQTLKAQDDSENTGVGLAIVKKIVEREKGTIRLESRLGQGTTFVFTWPKHHN
jgi:PAS domain S-box-containing protein